MGAGVSNLRPCVFFDRDGVVNVSPGEGYVTRWSDFHFMPGIAGVIRAAKAAGYAAAVITNQQGVAKGLMTEGDLAEIHAQMQAALAAEGAAFDAIYASTEPAGHPRRKPNPAMLHEAARDLDLDLARSWMIGDSDRDIECGQRAGARTVRVQSAEKPVGVPADFTVGDVRELIALLGSGGTGA